LSHLRVLRDLCGYDVFQFLSGVTTVEHEQPVAEVTNRKL
jgi:hypothetical protein